LPVGRRSPIDGHCFFIAPVAGGRGRPGKGEAKGHKVQERVGRRREVRYGIGKAIHTCSVVLEASCFVEHLVRLEATPSFENQGLPLIDLGLAIGLGSKILGGLVEKIGACGDVRFASGIEDANYAEKLLLCVEEAP